MSVLIQLIGVLLIIGVIVFILYYLPLISKDLHKVTKQNEEIIRLLENIADKQNK